MGKKFRLKVVFGEDATREVTEHPKTTYAKLRELGDAKKISFDSEAEREAYIQGIEDAQGWMEVCWEKKEG